MALAQLQKPQLQLHPSSMRRSVDAVSIAGSVLETAPTRSPPQPAMVDPSASFVSFGTSTAGSSSLYAVSEIGEENMPNMPTSPMSSPSLNTSIASEMKAVRVGRGGRGNVHRFNPLEARDPSPNSKKQIRKDKVIAPMGREMPLGVLGNKSSGRGGSGNIRNARSSVTTGASDKKRAELERREREIMEEYKRRMKQRGANLRMTGRGGLGNLKRSKGANKSKSRVYSHPRTSSTFFRQRFSQSLASLALSTRSLNFSTIIRSSISSGTLKRLTSRSSSTSSSRRLPGLEGYELESFRGSIEVQGSNASCSRAPPLQTMPETAESTPVTPTERAPFPPLGYRANRPAISVDIPKTRAPVPIRTKRQFDVIDEKLSPPFKTYLPATTTTTSDLQGGKFPSSTKESPLSPIEPITPKSGKRTKLKKLFIRRPQAYESPVIVPSSDSISFPPITPTTSTTSTPPLDLDFDDSAARSSTSTSTTSINTSTGSSFEYEGYNYRSGSATRKPDSQANTFGTVDSNIGDIGIGAGAGVSLGFVPPQKGDLEVRCYEDLESNLALRLAMARLRLM